MELLNIEAYIVRAVFPAGCLYYKPGKRFHWDEEGVSAANLMTKGSAQRVLNEGLPHWVHSKFMVDREQGLFKLEMVKLSCTE